MSGAGVVFPFVHDLALDAVLVAEFLLRSCVNLILVHKHSALVALLTEPHRLILPASFAEALS